MKKILCLFGALALVLTSCTSDEITDPSSILIKKIIYTDADGSVQNSIITYDGNKIVNILEGDYKIEYTYTGDVITKIEEIDENGNTQDLIEYTYSDGKVASFVENSLGDPDTYKTVYTYNTDGTVSYKVLNIDNDTNIESENSTGVLTFSSGNLVKEVRTSNSLYTSTLVYEYDDKINPIKNILGYNLLLDKEDTTSLNNTIKTTSIYDYGQEEQTYVFTTTRTYNENGFLVESKDFDNNGANGSTQYFY